MHESRPNTTCTFTSARHASDRAAPSPLAAQCWAPRHSLPAQRYLRCSSSPRCSYLCCHRADGACAPGCSKPVTCASIASADHRWRRHTVPLCRSVRKSSEPFGKDPAPESSGRPTEPPSVAGLRTAPCGSACTRSSASVAPSGRGGAIRRAGASKRAVLDGTEWDAEGVEEGVLVLDHAKDRPRPILLIRSIRSSADTRHPRDASSS